VELPGAKKHSAADKQAKARKIKLATSKGTTAGLELYLEPHLHQRKNYLSAWHKLCQNL
jgi:hypothetical protein